MPNEKIHDSWKENTESDIRRMGERLVGVEAGILSLGRNFDRFSEAFEASNNRQSELLKTRWPVVFGVLGLVAVIAGGFLSGYLRDLNRVEGDVTDIQKNRKSDQDGPQNTRLDYLTDKVMGIETRNESTLQSLHRHTNDGHPRRVEEQVDELRRSMDHVTNELDTVLLADPRQDQQLKDLQQAVADARKDEHANLTRDASAIERIRALERRVFDGAGGGIHDAETHHGEER